ncbi:MAG: hypothetical protein ABIV47_07710 [Roseiflexaceae bacterium]
MNHLVRGCLVLLLAGCIILGAGATFAITHFGLARPASERPNVLLNLGPLHIGSPCAQLQASYPTIRCKSSYYVVLRVSKSQLWSLEIP